MADSMECIERIKGARLTKVKFDAIYAATERRLIQIHANPDSIVDSVMDAPVTQ